MNLKELKKDLLNKVNHKRYFRSTLFKKDKGIYDRRSFDDLFKYYKQKGATEKMVLQALYETKFRARVCGGINKVIFYSFYEKCQKPSISIWASKIIPGHVNSVTFNYGRSTKDTKYDAAYIDKLFDSLKIDIKL